MSKEYKTVGQRLLERAAKLDADLDRLKEIEKLVRQKYPELLKADPELAKLIPADNCAKSAA
jgi:hypothetical protein